VDEGKRRKIADFLTEFKNIVVTGRGLDVIPREKNNLALIKLGITEGNRKDEILSLSLNDYCEGPEKDNDKPGDIWIFGKTVNDKEVYIKLKVAQVDEEKIAKCLSFHPAEFHLSYPAR
jgi:hypothetical protein